MTEHATYRAHQIRFNGYNWNVEYAGDVLEDFDSIAEAKEYIDEIYK